VNTDRAGEAGRPRICRLISAGRLAPHAVGRNGQIREAAANRRSFARRAASQRLIATLKDVDDVRARHVPPPQRSCRPWHTRAGRVLPGARTAQGPSLVDSVVTVAEHGTRVSTACSTAAGGRKPFRRPCAPRPLWTNLKNRIYVTAGTVRCARTADAASRQRAGWVEPRRRAASAP
jgi:hypothetical protein